jgi:hypothetical protein
MQAVVTVLRRAPGRLFADAGLTTASDRPAAICGTTQIRITRQEHQGDERQHAACDLAECDVEGDAL